MAIRKNTNDRPDIRFEGGLPVDSDVMRGSTSTGAYEEREVQRHAPREETLPAPFVVRNEALPMMPVTPQHDMSRPLAPKKLRAAQLLAGGSTVEAAAQEVGHARETVSRWLWRDPVFAAEVDRLRHVLAAEGETRLRALVPRATEVLSAALDDADPSVRLRAAETVLRNGVDRRSTLDVRAAVAITARLDEPLTAGDLAVLADIVTAERDRLALPAGSTEPAFPGALDEPAEPAFPGDGSVAP